MKNFGFLIYYGEESYLLIINVCIGLLYEGRIYIYCVKLLKFVNLFNIVVGMNLNVKRIQLGYKVGIKNLYMVKIIEFFVLENYI